MALTYAPAQGGTVGNPGDVIDNNGATVKLLVPAVQIVSLDSSGVATASPVNNASRPAGATVVGATSGNVAAAVATAALPAVALKTNYVEGFTITGAGATLASNVIATIAGLLGGTNSYIVTAPVGATVAIQATYVEFTTPRPASAVNTAITLSMPSLGTGNTHACVNIWGFVV